MKKTVAVEKKATNFLDTLVSKKDSGKTADIISAIGSSEMKELQTLSKSLKTPLKNISNPETSIITDNLIKMKSEVEAVSPGKFDLQPGWFVRMINKFTGNTAIGKYVAKFQTADTVIQAINRSLEVGKVQLKEDNVIFKDDKQRYIDAANNLKEKLDTLLEIDKKIDEELLIMEESEKKKFLQEEVSFRIKQQIQDLQQTQIVTQQGVIALDILVKNNDELIRSVNRVQNVTMSALSIGATLAVGLANQKKVLDTTNAVNEGTSDLIAANANLLKTQGADIQKQAAGAMLNVEKLQAAISDTIEAIEDVESFKIKALPEMKEAIGNLNKLTLAVDQKIEKIGKGEELNLLNVSTESKGA